MNTDNVNVAAAAVATASALAAVEQIDVKVVLFACRTGRIRNERCAPHNRAPELWTSSHHRRTIAQLERQRSNFAPAIPSCAGFGKLCE